MKMRMWVESITVSQQNPLHLVWFCTLCYSFCLTVWSIWCRSGSRISLGNCLKSFDYRWSSGYGCWEWTGRCVCSCWPVTHSHLSIMLFHPNACFASFFPLVSTSCYQDPSRSPQNCRFSCFLLASLVTFSNAYQCLHTNVAGMVTSFILVSYQECKAFNGLTVC